MIKDVTIHKMKKRRNLTIGMFIPMILPVFAPQPGHVYHVCNPTKRCAWKLEYSFTKGVKLE